MRLYTTLCALVLLQIPAFADEPVPNRPKVPGKLRLNLGERKDESGKVKVIDKTADWDVMETAIIVCDMWDDHYCKSAAQRVGAMAPKMNTVLTAARNHGVQIIHAPSDTIYIYAGTPHRKRMEQAKLAKPPVEIGKWCNRDPKLEPELPVDVSKCSCDDPVVGPYVRRYSKQHPGLDITGYDGVSDSGVEIYNFCREQGIKNIAIMGVHTNMCVLGRSFGIRQLVKLGMNVALVRDLTDAMYDPRQPPYVSHARGTELVVEHIERYWCPSILSKDLVDVIPGSAGPDTAKSQTRRSSDSSLRALAYDEPRIANPFYAMDTCTKRPYPKNDITPAAQLDLLKELGYAGIAWTEEPPDQVKAVAKAAADRKLKIFAIYCAAQATADGDLKHSPKLEDILAALKGHDCILWLHIGGKGPAFDSLTGKEPLVKKLRAIADAAKAQGQRVAVYPHVGEWTARFGDAVRLAKVVDHPEFGVTFNLCHALAMGDEENIPGLLDEGREKLFAVTINGADTGLKRPDWGRLIQTLDKGSFEVDRLLRQFHEIRYAGPIGLQGYGIPGDRQKNLAASMAGVEETQGKITPKPARKEASYGPTSARANHPGGSREAPLTHQGLRTKKRLVLTAPPPISRFGSFS